MQHVKEYLCVLFRHLFPLLLLLGRFGPLHLLRDHFNSLDFVFLTLYFAFEGKHVRGFARPRKLAMVLSLVEYASVAF